jgi:hypothetical protein
MTKNWYESKTLWTNISMFLLMVAALFLPGGEFTELLTPVAVKYVALGVAVLNIVLRVWFTTGAISK